MPNSATQYDTYKRVDVETASQGKLVVMLFNGAIQRAEEARRQIEKQNIEGVHNHLIRAQEIIAELRSALDMKAGEVARNLDRIYEYFQHLLIKANIRKEVDPLVECIEHMTTMRDTWQEAFAKAEKEGLGAGAHQINPHGNAVMNLQG